MAGLMQRLSSLFKKSPAPDEQPAEQEPPADPAAALDESEAADMQWDAPASDKPRES